MTDETQNLPTVETRPCQSLGASAGSASVECEIVPDRVAKIADAFERGQIVIGGNRGGKTWATKLVMARPFTDSATHDHLPDYGNDLRHKALR